jgi:hypothetical protein
LRRVLRAAAAALCAAACASSSRARSSPQASSPAKADATPPASAGTGPSGSSGATSKPTSDARGLLAKASAAWTRIDRAPLPPPEALPDLARDARACADDARAAWVAVQPEAATLAERGPARLGSVTPALSQVLAHADGTAAEPIYLFAACTSAWARAQGFTPLIDERDELRQMLTRVAQVAPDLDEAGAERELGKLFAALPAYAGGDLQQARSHFEAAVARAPDSARTRIAFARSVAVKAQDRALFLSQLQAAASSPDAAGAGEARDLLGRENELFGGPAEAAQPIPGGPTH